MTVTLQRLPSDGTPFPLGRHVQRDDRSRAYAFSSKLSVPRGITVHWPSVCKVLDQGDIGSCYGNAVAQWVNTDYAKSLRARVHANKPLTQEDALKIYSRATVLDRFPGSFPPVDTGTSGIGAAKAGIKLGYLDAYVWAFSWSSLQAAVELTPVIVGTLWTNTMFECRDGLVTVGSLKDSNIAGGHAYLCTGIDHKAGVLEFRQSWGERWPGAKPGGYFAITFKDYRRLFDMQAESLVPQMRKAVT